MNLNAFSVGFAFLYNFLQHTISIYPGGGRALEKVEADFSLPRKSSFYGTLNKVLLLTTLQTRK